jgi:WD40 repeat protein
MSIAKSTGPFRIARFSAALMLFVGALAGLLSASQGRDLPVQSIDLAGVTYNRAQVLDWIDDNTFAVGRWDGTISIFRTPKAGEFGPVVIQSMAAPSGRGLEMLAALDETTFITSDGPSHLAVWKRPAAGGAAPEFALAQEPAYDQTFGAANSATSLDVSGSRYVATGHENGDLLIWIRHGDKLELVSSISLRSPNPIPSPYHLRNIRGLVPWGTNAIAGSEDGDLVGVSIPDGREIFRLRYNPAAQRGINSVSILGNWLLVTNCSVGSADKNLWLYDLSATPPVLRDSENLVLDTQRAQVFNFDAVLFEHNGAPSFFSSTEEGLLWAGKLDGDQLVITGITKIASEGGATVHLAPRKELIAAAAYQIWLFRER